MRPECRTARRIRRAILVLTAYGQKIQDGAVKPAARSRSYSQPGNVAKRGGGGAELGERSSRYGSSTSPLDDGRGGPTASFAGSISSSTASSEPARTS
jgi:hypothetical protein